MRFSFVAATWTVSVLLRTAAAWPGMSSTLDELHGRLQSRQDGDDGAEDETGDDEDSRELLGDLLTLSDSQLTPVGKTVKAILLGTQSAESNVARYNILTLPLKGSKACKADTCCIWQYISNEMFLKFVGLSGRCTNLARAAIRLGFHDAAGWSKSTGTGGGADGSLVLAPAEILRPENNGLQDVVGQMKTWYNAYKAYGVGMADLVQMGATVATVACPLGPRIRSYVGRRDSSAACTDGLLPGVHQDADALISLFEDKTIRPHGLTALIGAHTTSQQRFVDPSRAGDPQDSSPGVWDVKFYTQTLGDAPPRVFRFDSDVALAQDSRVSAEFQKFASDQSHWNEDYAREYVRLSLLGVYNINDLTDCTKVLPVARTSFKAIDQDLINKWVNTTEVNKKVADAVLNGDILTGLKAIISALKKLVRSRITRRNGG